MKNFKGPGICLFLFFDVLLLFIAMLSAKKKKNIGRKKSKYQLRKYINSNYNEKPQFDPNVTSKCSVFPYNFPILLILIIHFIVI